MGFTTKTARPTSVRAAFIELVKVLAKLAFCPLVGIFKWRYVLTPLALPVCYESRSMTGGDARIAVRGIYVFGVRVASWRVLVGSER